MSLPSWLLEAIDLGDTPEGRVYSNRHGSSVLPLNPQHLAVLQDIIDLNRLEESSAVSDYDDDDGIFGPLELGFQLWIDGDLVALSLGADPYSSFGYQIEALPPSIGDLDRLRLLDVQSNRLAELPYEIGLLVELRELRAHRNELVELPESFSMLTRLRGAHLSRNRLTRLPESIGDLKTLEWLYVSDNPLVELPAGVGDLESLRLLGLQNTAIDPSRPGEALAWVPTDGLSILPETVDSLLKLDALYVTGNQIGCFDGRALERFASGSRLRVFGLSAQRCSP